MKLISLLFLAILFYLLSFTNKQQVSWKAPEQADTLVNPIKDSAVAIKAGGNLFEAQCSSCHGKTGKGDGMAASSLKPHPTNLQSPAVKNQTDGAIFWKISTGKAPMPPFAGLSIEQRWQLVEFIRKLQTGTVSPKDVPSPKRKTMMGCGRM